MESNSDEISLTTKIVYAFTGKHVIKDKLGSKKCLISKYKKMNQLGIKERERRYQFHKKREITLPQELCMEFDQVQKGNNIT